MRRATVRGFQAPDLSLSEPSGCQAIYVMWAAGEEGETLVRRLLESFQAEVVFAYVSVDVRSGRGEVRFWMYFVN